MIIRFKKSYGGTGITIDSRGKDVPIISVGDEELKEDVDYAIEEKEKKEVTQVVLEWMGNQSVFFYS